MRDELRYTSLSSEGADDPDGGHLVVLWKDVLRAEQGRETPHTHDTSSASSRALATLLSYLARNLEKTVVRTEAKPVPPRRAAVRASRPPG